MSTPPPDASAPRRHRVPLLALALALLPALLLPAPREAAAAPSPEQRREATQLKTALRKAERLLDDGQAREAAALVKATQERFAALATGGGADVVGLLKPTLEQLGGLHALLELEGLKLPPLPELADAAPPMPAPGAAPGAPAAGQISFARQIAPLIVAKCGGCHVNESKGKVSMANFAALMRGSPDAGTIILPRKGEGSRIVEVIDDKSMPKGGGKVSQAERNLLVSWIDQGASFDGPNPETPLRQLARAATRPAAAAPMEVTRATGNEKVRFGRDVAPVLVAQCGGCHIRDNDGGLAMTSFTRLLRGGDSGPLVVPGKPAESTLIARLTGPEDIRMPKEKPPLPTDVIEKISTWIAEGAKFDAPDPAASLDRVAAVVRAELSTPEELTRMRVELAEKNWRLAIPDADARTHSSEHFLIVGSVGEETLQDVARRAEAQASRVATTLKVPADRPLVKGNVTIYVFAQRYDYAELGTMVEKRTLPRAWRGHWRYDVVDPYAAVVLPSGDQYSLDVLLAQQLASLHLAGRRDGQLDRWLAEGIGRAVAAKLDAKDPRVEAWDGRIGEILGRIDRPDDFMTGKLSPEDSDVLSYSFSRLLMSSSSRFGKLLKALDGGTDAGAALQTAYGGTPQQLAGQWATRAARGR